MIHALVLFIFGISTTFASDPWDDGPYIAKHNLYWGTFNGGLDHQLDVWAPDTPGKFPIIYNLGGMGAIFPGDMYDSTFKHLASHGVIIVQAWALLTNPANNYKAEWLFHVHEWVLEHMEDKLHGSGIDSGLQIDFDNIVMMGHSSGAHVVVEFLKHHCEMVRGQILFSPVDGVDPFGLINNFAITPGEYLNYSVPTLVMMAGLDGEPGSLAGDLTPACVPEGLGNMRFYDALPGPTWMINATDYGHGDVIDEFYYWGLVLTKFCSTDTSQDRKTFRNFIAAEIWSYLTMVIHQDCQYLPNIEDSSLMTVETIAFSKPSVNSDWQCGQESRCKYFEV